MKLYLNDEFTIQTNKSEEDIARILEEKLIASKKIPKAPFRGTFDNDSFKVTRKIIYRNSFLPVVRGVLINTPSGVKIEVKMNMYLFIRIFMAFWFVGWSAGSLFIVIEAINKNMFSLESLGGIGILMIAYLMVWGAFWYEARKQKVMLLKAFE